MRQRAITVIVDGGVLVRWLPYAPLAPLRNDWSDVVCGWLILCEMWRHGVVIPTERRDSDSLKENHSVPRQSQTACRRGNFEFSAAEAQKQLVYRSLSLLLTPGIFTPLLNAPLGSRCRTKIKRSGAWLNSCPVQ